MDELSKCSTLGDASSTFPSQDSSLSLAGKKWPHGPEGEPFVSVTTIEHSPSMPSPFAGFRVRGESGSTTTTGGRNRCQMLEAVIRVFDRLRRRNRSEGVWNRRRRIADDLRDGWMKFLTLMSCGLLQEDRRNDGCSLDSTYWWMSRAESVASMPSIISERNAFTIGVPSYNNLSQYRVASEGSGESGWYSGSLESIELSNWSVIGDSWQHRNRVGGNGVTVRLEDAPHGFTGNAFMSVNRNPPSEETWVEVRGYILESILIDENKHDAWRPIIEIAIKNEGVPPDEDWKMFINVFFETADAEFRKSAHWEQLKRYLLKPVQAVVYVPE